MARCARFTIRACPRTPDEIIVSLHRAVGAQPHRVSLLQAPGGYRGRRTDRPLAQVVIHPNELPMAKEAVVAAKGAQIKEDGQRMVRRRLEDLGMQRASAGGGLPVDMAGIVARHVVTHTR